MKLGLLLDAASDIFEFGSIVAVSLTMRFNSDGFLLP
tara:strand:+ start:708 stop:818 length:111 start_codon:yes stop_codon:yes gene_type:complete